MQGVPWMSNKYKELFYIFSILIIVAQLIFCDYIRHSTYTVAFNPENYSKRQM